MKKLTCLFLSFLMAAAALAGCAGQSAGNAAAGESSAPQTEKTAQQEKVVVACWGN